MRKSWNGSLAVIGQFSLTTAQLSACLSGSCWFHAMFRIYIHTAMLPVRGKTRQHCCAQRGLNKMILKIFRNIAFVSRTQNLRRTQMLRAWQNDSTFVKHDHVTPRNIAAKMCPRFCRPLTFSEKGCFQLQPKMSQMEETQLWARSHRLRKFDMPPSLRKGQCRKQVFNLLSPSCFPTETEERNNVIRGPCCIFWCCHTVPL